MFTAWDQAATRRRHVAALAIIGVPLSMSRRSQLMQTGAPLLIGLPSAAACGLLTGSAYLGLLNAQGPPIMHTPLRGFTVIAATAIGAAMLIAVITTLGLGKRIRAIDLRHE